MCVTQVKSAQDANLKFTAQAALQCSLRKDQDPQPSDILLPYPLLVPSLGRCFYQRSLSCDLPRRPGSYGAPLACPLDVPSLCSQVWVSRH